MEVGRTKSSGRSPKTTKPAKPAKPAELALSLSTHHGHTPASSWSLPLALTRPKLGLRLLFLVWLVLLGAFTWGRACLLYARVPHNKRGGEDGEVWGGSDFAPFEVALSESSRRKPVPDQLGARLAQLELQVKGARGIPGWSTAGGSVSTSSLNSIAKGSSGRINGGKSDSNTDSSSSDVQRELVQVLVQQHKELQSQRLLIVESWRQIRSLRRHLKDLQSTQSTSAASRSLSKYLHSTDENPSKSQKQSILQYTLQYNRPNCTAGNGPYFYSPSTSQQNGPRAGSSRFQKLRWAPQKGKYLLATCVFGRASNRLLCLRNYILAATLLQRTLILPTRDLRPAQTRWNAAPEAAYNFDLAYNVTQLNACFQTPVIISLTRYLHSFKVQKLKVDKLLCWAKHCRFINGKSNLWPQEPKIFFPKPVETSLNRTATTAAFLSAFGGVPDRILCLGDLFDGHAYFADAPPGFHHGLLDSWHAPGQLADGQELSGQVAGRAAGAGSGAGAGVEGGSSGAPGECRALIWPNEMVLSSARGFVQEVLGQRYASIHLRRDDMFRHCVAQAKCQYWPQREAAECVLAKMRRHGLELLFLASDSSNEDLSLFLTMLQEPRDLGPPIKVVRLGRMQGKMWAEALNRAGTTDDPMVVATVEKVVCAISKLFMGTHSSTFSLSIADFRMALGTATCEDGDFCGSIGAPEVLPL